MDNSEKKPTDGILSLPFEKIQTVFQIGNPNIYRTINNCELSAEKTISILGETMCSVGIKDGEYLLGVEDARIDNATLHHANEPDGGFVCGMAYRLNRDGDYSENRFSLFIGQLIVSEDGKRFYAEPHYILTGCLHGEIFVPQDSVCLANDTNTMIGYRDEEEFHASLCYADAAFKTIISGIALDSTENQFWLTRKASSNVRDVFNFICNRDAKELTQELILRHNDPSKFVVGTKPNDFLRFALN
jgi:hypothetical protein